MGAHSDHCEDDADDAKDGLGWCNVREISRDIQTLDDHIQRGEDVFSMFRVFGFGFHGFKASAEVKGRCSGRAVRRMLSLGL